jgi:hypothetical protein
MFVRLKICVGKSILLAGGLASKERPADQPENRAVLALIPKPPPRVARPVRLVSLSPATHLQHAQHCAIFRFNCYS